MQSNLESSSEGTPLMDLVEAAQSAMEAAEEQQQMSATGFLIFTVISGLMALYIFWSVIQTCTRYRELKQQRPNSHLSNDRHLLSLREDSSSALSMNGLKCKSLFFIALLSICLLRTICLVIMTLKFSELNSDPRDDAPLNVLIKLLLDLPTLILISVFSAFAYQLSSLNMEVETIMHELDEQQHQTAANLVPTARPSSSQEQFLQVHGEQIRENTTGFAKMFFIISNLLLTIFYFVCFAKYHQSIRDGESDYFDKWVRTFTGISFLVLGISILKYGSQLETTITHASTLKSALATQMEGLDLRILSITILLSLVFLSRALVDCMFAFNLINEQLNSFVVLLCIIVFSEVCTSVAVVRLMKKGARLSSSASAPESNDNDFLRANSRAASSAHKATGDRHSSARAAQQTNTRSGDQPSSSQEKEHLDSSYSSYGSFNPNRGQSMPLSPRQALLTPVQDQADQLVSGGQQQQSDNKKMSKNYSAFLAAHHDLIPKSSLKASIEDAAQESARPEVVVQDIFGMPVKAYESGDSDGDAPLFN